MSFVKLKDNLSIAIGTLFIALSVEVFLLPSKISCGGISTIGTVLYYTFRIPLSFSNTILNIFLFALGIKFLEKTYVRKTIYGIVLFAVFLEITAVLPDYKGDVLPAVISGGFFLGIGLGLVIRVGGSTGGSDFAGIIGKKIFPYISVPVMISVIDTIIILISGIVFSSFTIVVYSLVVIVISLKISDLIICFGNAARQIIVNSEKSPEIAEVIMKKFGRGVTGIYSKGMYTERDRMLIMTVVNPREVHRIIELIKSHDTNAFVIICEAKEVLGEGFKIG